MTTDDSKLQQLTADRQRFYDNWKEVEAELESTKAEVEHLRRELAKLRDRHPNGRGALDWVIAGCESGPGMRSCDVAWLRSLRDQCAAAGVAFFLKQAVGTIHESYESRGLGALEAGDGSKRKQRGVIELPYLDGVQHAAFPEVPR